MVTWLQGGRHQFLPILDVYATSSLRRDSPFLERELGLVTRAGASDFLGLLRLNPAASAWDSWNTHLAVWGVEEQGNTRSHVKSPTTMGPPGRRCSVNSCN